MKKSVAGIQKPPYPLRMSNTAHAMNAEAQNIINEINRLTSANAEITKSGGFFTEEQVANEKVSWKLKMNLRFDHGMEIGTY